METGRMLGQGEAHETEWGFEHVCPISLDPSGLGTLPGSKQINTLQISCHSCHPDGGPGLRVRGSPPPGQQDSKLLLCTPGLPQSKVEGMIFSGSRASPRPGLGRCQCRPTGPPLCHHLDFRGTSFPSTLRTSPSPRPSSMRGRTRTLKCAECCSPTRSCAGEMDCVTCTMPLCKDVTKPSHQALPSTSQHPWLPVEAGGGVG
jgi:hypothetical protein